MITIHYNFTYLNDYIKAERSNKYKAAKIKRDTTYAISLMLRGKKIETPCRIHYHWLITSKRRDLDNVQHAAKYINDALVKANVIPNDNVNHIYEIKHTFEISDKNGVKLEVY